MSRNFAFELGRAIAKQAGYGTAVALPLAGAAGGAVAYPVIARLLDMFFKGQAAKPMGGADLVEHGKRGLVLGGGLGALHGGGHAILHALKRRREKKEQGKKTDDEKKKYN